MVSFTLRLLYTRGNTPSYPLDRRLCGSQSRSVIIIIIIIMIRNSNTKILCQYAYNNVLLPSLENVVTCKVRSLFVQTGIDSLGSMDRLITFWVSGYPSLSCPVLLPSTTNQPCWIERGVETVPYGKQCPSLASQILIYVGHKTLRLTTSYLLYVSPSHFISPTSLPQRGSARALSLCRSCGTPGQACVWYQAM
jgi:hypothetical protein